MSRFARIRRRPDHWASPHERARVRAAERMDGPLGLAESTWLDDHLAGCPACTAIAAQYERDRVSLRTLRDPAPVPPRDLWARTSAAIERESGAHGGRRAARAGGRTRPAWPLGALSGIAVIVVVIGLSAVSSGMLVLGTPSHGVGGDDGSAAVAGSSPTDDTTAVAAATPILVGAGDVAYVAGGGGQLAYSQVGVDEVCAATDTSECGTLADAGPSRIAISNAPKAIISSPTNPNTAIVVDRDAAGNDRIRIVVLPSPSPDTTLASASPAPTVAPSSPPASPSPTVEPSVEPSAAVESPSPSASASAEPSVEPSGSVPASEAPTASATPPSPSPTVEPSAEPTPTPVATPVITMSPTPTIPAALPIASGLEVLGESAAFSRDGAWFAFTARPTEHTAGPDIWVWQVGEPSARQLTTDGRSVFASWAGDEVVGSRPVTTDTATDTAEAQTFTLDPKSGDTTATTTGTWRPAVDPKERYAVGWTGTVGSPTSTTAFAPAAGRLELGPWSASNSAAPQTLVDGPIRDFDVRWDETGEWVGVWIQDPGDPTFGRLTLYHVDPATGRLKALASAPKDVPALPGFSIADGRMAWATPPGQGGEGSRVQIAAWTKDAIGTVETVPGEDVVIVR